MTRHRGRWALAGVAVLVGAWLVVGLVPRLEEVTTLGLTRSLDVPLGRTVFVGFSADLEPAGGAWTQGVRNSPASPPAGSLVQRSRQRAAPA